jgi:hypothetical protein
MLSRSPSGFVLGPHGHGLLKYFRRIAARTSWMR